MKKLLCILATAALFGACEQKTEVVTPAAPPAKETPDPAKAARLNRRTTPAAATTETKTETTTTVPATPNP
jgi:hypothetical protein